MNELHAVVIPLRYVLERKTARLYVCREFEKDVGPMNVVLLQNVAGPDAIKLLFAKSVFNTVRLLENAPFPPTLRVPAILTLLPKSAGVLIVIFCTPGALLF